MTPTASDSRPPFGSILLGNIHWVIVGTLVLYVVASEAVGFYMVGPPIPGQDRVALRYTECMILWVLSYTVINFGSIALKKPMLTRRGVWWSAIVVVFFGIVAAAWGWWRNQLGGVAPAERYPPGMLRTYLILAPLTPAVFGLVMAAVFWLEAVMLRRIWRVLGRAGRYCKCGYDLTGNVSGTCPECGTKIERRASLLGHEQ